MDLGSRRFLIINTGQDFTISIAIEISIKIYNFSILGDLKHGTFIRTNYSFRFNDSSIAL